MTKYIALGMMLTTLACLVTEAQKKPDPIALPRYPQLMRNMRIVGEISVEVRVEEGRVVDVEKVASNFTFLRSLQPFPDSDRLFFKQVERAVSQWNFVEGHFSFELVVKFWLRDKHFEEWDLLRETYEIQGSQYKNFPEMKIVVTADKYGPDIHVD